MNPRILLLILLTPCTALGEIYKWVDNNGQTHYGEKSENPSSKKIIIPEQKKNPKKVTASEKQRLENVKKWVDARQQEREKEKQKKQELRKKRNARKKKCTELKLELNDLEQGGVLWYRLDEQGKRQFYSDDEMNTRKEGLRETLKKNCK